MHPEEQVEQLANSIQEFGFTVPIVVDEKMNVLAGHGRLMAANRLGLEKVPVLIVRHFSEKQKRAYIIADNKIAQNSTWDQELLKELAVELDGEEVDLEVVGFSAEEIEELTVPTSPAKPTVAKSGSVEKTETATCPNCNHKFDLVD
jgi:ParB-like chromosome segregation protein Spo0J